MAILHIYNPTANNIVLNGVTIEATAHLVIENIDAYKFNNNERLTWARTTDGTEFPFGDGNSGNITTFSASATGGAAALFVSLFDDISALKANTTDRWDNGGT